MDRLWTPWRYTYITSVDSTPGCVFCQKPEEQDDAANGIVFRGKHNFIILNAFPYTSGHVMVVPYAHLDELHKLPEEAAHELISLSQRMERVLRDTYRAEGVNLGMNIGRCAGAGVAGHIHVHVLPRWTGDANFLSVTGETRVLPESLEVTYRRISEKLREG